MIRVNLKYSGAKKKTLLNEVDLGAFNLKNIILAILTITLPTMFIESEWEDELKGLDAQVAGLNAEKTEIQRKLKELDKLNLRVQDLKKQETDLVERLKIVEKVVASRINPMKVMLYIAENIPPNVWIDQMSIENNRMKINGYAKSFKNIGEFISNLKQSVFFGQKVNLENYVTKELNRQGVRVEEFYVTADIERYE